MQTIPPALMFGIIRLPVYLRECRETVAKGHEVLGSLLASDDCVVPSYAALLMFTISGLFKCKEEENEL